MQKNEKDNLKWLENTHDYNVQNWIRNKNATTCKKLENHSKFDVFYNEVFTSLNKSENIPLGEIYGDYVYHFCRNSTAPNGQLKRTSLANYALESIPWEEVLDIDQLARDEKKNYVYRGFIPLLPEAKRCLIKLSHSGKDAEEIREFDLINKVFILDGFCVPEAQTSISWIDINTVLIATDFGPHCLSSANYPIIVKKWSRGQHLLSSTMVTEGKENALSVYIHNYMTPTSGFHVISYKKKDSQFHNYTYDQVHLSDLPCSENLELVGFLNDWFFYLVKYESQPSDIRSGSLIAMMRNDNCHIKEQLHCLWQKTANTSLQQVEVTKNAILISILEDVQSSIIKFTYVNDIWVTEKVDLPHGGNKKIFFASSFSNQAFILFENFLTPTTLFLYDTLKNSTILLKSNPKVFDASNMIESQKFAISKDGTKIPYFIITQRTSPQNGRNPTWIYAYGGFDVSFPPQYLSHKGKLWIQNGGIFVIANIRGGGEYGPTWHDAATQKNRHKAFEDVVAVTNDLIRTKITSPQYLGFYGGSNGGLLAGVLFTKYSHLYQAIIALFPILNMLKYHEYPPGSMWISEYGDPTEASMYKYLRSYSPIHNVKKNMNYPSIFLIASQTDDRVHPSHARKMVAKLDQYHYEYDYFENEEGGHLGFTNYQQASYLHALEYAFFYKHLFKID